MQLKLLLSLAFALVLILIFSYPTISILPFYSFEISLPEEISLYPGEEVQINGSILNTGLFWLREFNLTLKGLPKGYEYNITPSYWESLRILREWTPEKGVYRIPEKFLIRIKAPEDAFGAHLLNLTGQEFGSWRKVSNSTFFVLRVLPLPNISISDILVPENITEFQDFNISFKVINEGLKETIANFTVFIPVDWNISQKDVSVLVPANDSVDITLTVTPTNTSGNISIFLRYPFKEEIITLTKYGPYLTPLPFEIPVKPPLEIFFEWVKTPLGIAITTVAIILLIIILWNVWKVAKFYRLRKRPEKMKSSEEKTTSLDLLES